MVMPGWDKDRPVHLRHFEDGYPLCWPQERDGLFQGSFHEEDVTCPACLRYIKAEQDG